MTKNLWDLLDAAEILKKNCSDRDRLEMIEMEIEDIREKNPSEYERVKKERKDYLAFEAYRIAQDIEFIKNHMAAM